MTDWDDDEEQCCPITDETLVYDAARVESEYKRSEIEGMINVLTGAVNRFSIRREKKMSEKLKACPLPLEDAQAKMIAEQALRIKTLEAELEEWRAQFKGAAEIIRVSKYEGGK